MAAFVLVEDTAHSPAGAWQRVTEWTAHGRYVPLTTVRVDPPGPSHTGTVFTARTAVGRIGFDDPMEIVQWQPPAGPGVAGEESTGQESAGRGFCRMEKRGRVMLGWAEITVEPTDTGSRVTWREDAAPAHLPTFLSPVATLSGRLLFGRVLRKLLA